jgi:hypothetical protein
MKRLSIGLLALTVMLALSGNASAPKTTASRDVYLYWYDTGDNYVDEATVSQEEYNLEVKYGVLVDTNPMGGTLLERGYQDYGKPHFDFPLATLYGHFGH